MFSRIAHWNFGGAKSPPRISTLVLMAGTSVMAMNIFLPVLPLIGLDFGVSDARSQYVLTLFLAATAVAQLFIGSISDRYGRRPVLLAAFVIFLIGTLVCIFSTTFEWLLFGRLLQAATAAAMVLSRAIIRDLFERNKAASMIGYVTMAMAAIPMVAPSIGGVVGEFWGWRGTFVVLAIAAFGLLVLVWFDLGETHSPSDASIIQQMRNYGTLLREPMMWGYCVTASLASGAYFAFLGGAPFVGLKIIGMSASQLGFYFAFVAFGYMAGNFITGRFSERYGIELMMLYGGIIACIGVIVSLTLMSLFEPRAEYLFLPMAMVGFGNGMTLPNANAGAVSVRPQLAGSASGIGGFLQIGGGALLAVASGNLISVANQAMPLYIIMFLSSAGAALIALLMFQISKNKGKRAAPVVLD